MRTIVTQEFTTARTGLSFIGWSDCKKLGETSDVYLFAMRAGDDTQARLYDLTRPETPAGQASMGQGGIREEYVNVEGQAGSGYRRRNLKKKPFVFLKLPDYSTTHLSVRETLEMNALHEFGHLAGLRHEHLREEAKSDPNCTLANTDLQTKEHESFLLSAKNFSRYDPQSIMNYCHLDLMERTIGLKFVERTSTNPMNYPDSVVYDDPSIVKKILSTADFSEYSIRLGLSAGDVHGLRCLYAYPLATRRLRCTETYDPVSSPTRN